MKQLFTLMTLLLTTMPFFLQAAEKASQKPNIIFILADDLGTGNVSCYGADHFKTPNIDSLAKSGIRFEHCYTSPLCGPSRALLLTGRYAFRTGMTGNDCGSFMKPAKETMMPIVLKQAGYVTGMCGKWSQMPLQPSDWGFQEYLRFQGSGKYWNSQKGTSTYTVNGNEVPLRDNEYLPDKMHEFVVAFINRHKDEPFYLHYAMSHVHGEILRTPDSAPNCKDFYADNVAYMDKLVGKLVAELERLKLRENTLIVFAGDNGTAKTAAARSTINGKALSGCKGTMLECGALVPCIASWPAQAPAGKVAPNLIDFSDFFPTFAEVAGTKAPEGLTIDGKSFAPQLRGQLISWPREWIFVELGKHWYDREVSWKLNQSNELFDMRDAPFQEPLVPADKESPEATAARKRLQAVLDQLNPAGGIVDKGDGSGKYVRNKAVKKEQKKGAIRNTQNANNKNQ